MSKETKMIEELIEDAFFDHAKKMGPEYQNALLYKLEDFEAGARWAMENKQPSKIEKVIEELEWALMTIRDKLQFGLPEEIAVYRRESRVKGVLITAIKNLKGKE